MTTAAITSEPESIIMPPASIEAEEALLGSLMISPDLLRTTAVDPADFYIVRHRWILEAMLDTASTGGQVDYLTVCDALERRGKLNDIGGPAYLIGLLTKTPSSMHAGRYAEIVRDRAQRRRVLQIANELAQSAYALGNDISNSISQAAVDLAASVRPVGGAQHASVFASRHYDRISQLAQGQREVQRISTGFLDFDRCLGGGLRIPEMLLLVGRPGLGKTKFILQLAFQMGAHMPGPVYEMETAEQQIMDREFSRRTRIADTRLEQGGLTDEEWAQYLSAVDAVSSPTQTQVYLDFGCNWTTGTLQADLAKLKAEHGIRWYMVDYMKFLRDSHGKDEIERLHFFSGRLKQINRELELASVVIHSMNKEGLKNPRPDLSNMSLGADIAFDTDKALFMMPHVPSEGRPAMPNYRTFIFQKSRSRLGDAIFHLEAVKEYPQFRDVATIAQAQSEPRRPRDYFQD